MNRLDELVRATLDDRAEQAPSPIPVVNRVLARRRRPTRRAWLVASAAAAATAAIVAVGVTVATDPDAGSDPLTAAETEDRTVTIYSLVLERFLRTSADWRAGNVPDQVYVQIRPDEDAGWDFDGQAAGDPIPPDVQDEISAELADLTTLSWVEKFPPSVRGDTRETSDPAIRLGLLPSGDQVNVSVSAYHGFDNAWLTTYVVARENGGPWRITGTDAPMGLT